MLNFQNGKSRGQRPTGHLERNLTCFCHRKMEGFGFIKEKDVKYEKEDETIPRNREKNVRDSFAHRVTVECSFSEHFYIQLR